MKTVFKILQTTIAVTVVIQIAECSNYHGVDEKRMYEVACHLCRTMTSSFERTEEMTRGVRRKQSDERFSDIMRFICSDVQQNIQQRCKNLANVSKELLHVWWENTMIDKGLYEWMCIDELELCCPSMHYGKNCTPCDDYPVPCSGHGKCDGDGFRIGDGHCICIKPYSGNNCETCDIGYYGTYVTLDGYTDLTCSPCHEACQDECFSVGPKGCHSCAPGWYRFGVECVDINECTNQTICGARSYCINTPGSYDCRSCHLTCKSCYGSTMTECIECDDHLVFDYFGFICVTKTFRIISQDLLGVFFIFVLIARLIFIQLPEVIAICLVWFLGFFYVRHNIDCLMKIMFDTEEYGNTNVSNSWNINNISLFNSYFE